MAQLKFFKVLVLPATLEANSVYFVANGNYAETYITDTAGVAKSVGNSQMITDKVTELMGGSTFQVVSDIAQRDAIDVSAGKSFLVLVTNATGDPTVAGGGALYAHNTNLPGYEKVAEYESMDVTLLWGNIEGRPNSTPTQIDDAVANASMVPQLGTEMIQAQQDIIRAQGDAEAAQIAADAAQLAANAAQGAADMAQLAADNAQGAATSAATDASEAMTAATSAQGAANAAQTTADDALIVANAAQTTATEALSTANQNSTDIETLTAVSHSHANETVISQLDVDANGNLTFNGNTVNAWTASEW